MGPHIGGKRPFSLLINFIFNDLQKLSTDKYSFSGFSVAVSPSVITFLALAFDTLIQVRKKLYLSVTYLIKLLFILGILTVCHRRYEHPGCPYLKAVLICRERISLTSPDKFGRVGRVGRVGRGRTGQTGRT